MNSRTFNFQPDGHLMIGVEREFFLQRSGLIVPIAHEILQSWTHPALSYELSACQLESHIGPCRRPDIRRELEIIDRAVREAEVRLNFNSAHIEVAPEDMPLDVYPEERYINLAKILSRERLMGACRVAGTHVHIGMKDAETAMRVYNQVIDSWQYLAKIGDHSNGERLKLYTDMAPNYEPIRYENWDRYNAYLDSNGYNGARDCYHFIRLSIHGTIEFRVFGATSSVDEIELWAHKCHDLCAAAV